MTQSSRNKTGRMTNRRALTISGLASLALGIVLAAIGWLVAWYSLVWIGVVAAVTGAVWLLCSRFTNDEPMRLAGRRYLREFFPPMIAYIVILLAVIPMMKHVHAGPLKALLALLPVVPVVFVMRAMLRMLLGSDELEQKQQLEAISISAMTVALLSFASAFLQIFGLLPIDNALMLVLPAMFGTYGVALFWVKRKYRDE